MSEGTFLLLFGASFGIPLLIAFVLFGIFMIKHSKELDESAMRIDEIRKRREAIENIIN